MKVKKREREIRRRKWKEAMLGLGIVDNAEGFEGFYSFFFF